MESGVVEETPLRKDGASCFGGSDGIHLNAKDVGGWLVSKMVDLIS